MFKREGFGLEADLRSISFNFDRLSNEGATAVFKIADRAEEYMSEIMKRVTNCSATSTTDLPGHLVCVRGAVFDSDVSDMAVDEEQREISVDWRAMLSQFFAEDKLGDYYLKRYVGPR